MIFVHLEGTGEQIVLSGRIAHGQPGRQTGQTGQHRESLGKMLAIARPTLEEKVVDRFDVSRNFRHIESIGVILP